MATLTIAEALERYGRRCKPVKKQQTLAALEKYLRWGGQPTDENLAAYLQHLASLGQKPATVDLRRRQIQAFWRALGITPPRAALDFNADHDSERPALAHELVAHLVAQRDAYPRYTQALLALAALYGPRAIELSRVQPHDVDLERGRWYIRSAKGSRPRWLWIPEAVRPVLDIRWPKVSAAHVEERFHELWILAELDDRPDHVNWHAVRRALTGELADKGVPDGPIAQFMRWASGGPGGHAMVELYKKRTQTIGLTGTQAEPRFLEGTEAEDAAVWECHPFLPLWRVRPNAGKM